MFYKMKPEKYKVDEKDNKLFYVTAEYFPAFKNVGRYKYDNSKAKGHFYRDELIEVYLDDEERWFKGKSNLDSEQQVYVSDGERVVYIKDGMRARFYFNDKTWLD